MGHVTWPLLINSAGPIVFTEHLHRPLISARLLVQPSLSFATDFDISPYHPKTNPTTDKVSHCNGLGISPLRLDPHDSLYHAAHTDIRPDHLVPVVSPLPILHF